MSIQETQSLDYLQTFFYLKDLKQIVSENLQAFNNLKDIHTLEPFHILIHYNHKVRGMLCILCYKTSAYTMLHKTA